MVLVPYILRPISKRSLSSLFLFLGAAVIPSPTRAFYSSMSTFTTERTGDGLVTVSPKNEGDQSALVVIAHGLGDTAEGFADVAEVRCDACILVGAGERAHCCYVPSLDGQLTHSNRLFVLLDRCLHANCPI